MKRVRLVDSKASSIVNNSPGVQIPEYVDNDGGHRQCRSNYLRRDSATTEIHSISVG